MIVPVLLSGLLGFTAATSIPLQEHPDRPRGKAQGDKSANREKLENLVKLPDDFVQFARVPDGGLSPRIGRGKDDLALIYFKGEGSKGDLFLTRSSDEAKTFSPGLQLDSEPGTVAAWDGVHRGAIAVGPDGTAHVAWITTGDAPGLRYVRAPVGGPASAPLDLGSPSGLCSTAAIAVDASGQVFVFYAAPDTTPATEGPTPVRVWMRRSADGASFSEPTAIDGESMSVSGQSAMAAHVDDVVGKVYVLYRTAFEVKPGVKSLMRGIRLLSSDDHGAEFKASWVDPERATRDPRSSAGLTQEPQTTLATWDSDGQVYWALVRRQVDKVNLPMNPHAEEGEVEVVRSEPAGAGGGTEIFMVWLERPKEDPAAPAKLAWRVWMREGRAPIGGGFAPDAPGPATPIAFPRKEHGFTVIY
jgi:hypothetical protein